VTIGWSLAGVEEELAVEDGVLVGDQRLPVGHGALPRLALRRIGRPLTNSKVVSSGAIMPARAPPSMLMLQIVMRLAMLSLRMALPRYSKT
jgi:hypothetical protein